MSLTTLPHGSHPCAQSSTDPSRRAAPAEPLNLTRVLGDLGAWLEETEHHRKRAANRPTIR